MEKNYIKVNVKALNHDEVCDIYNRNKSEDMLPLKKLNRLEGGFMLELPDKQDLAIDANEKCKQLRWHRGFLKPHLGYIGFNSEELETLYSALEDHLGEGQVEWHERILIR